MMTLTDPERAMLEGRQGKARQKAMELLVRYAEALGADRFVDTRNVAGVPGTSNALLEKLFANEPGDRYQLIYSRFDLDSDDVVQIPRMTVHACHLQGGVDPEQWRELGATPAALKISQDGEIAAANHGVHILKTCTPYLAGNVPAFGEHCAWMESSAVVYCNSVLGARTNTEGRESTSAAMLTGKIPDWGLHRDENRLATHHIEVETEIESVMDWGLLGYFVGTTVGENVPVLKGRLGRPDLLRHKHFGAAAASSGGVEMYHITGVTPEAPTFEAACAPRDQLETLRYGASERRRTYEQLNSTARDRDVDFVMLGCPHYSLEQIREVCVLLDGKKVSGNCKLWIFTSRAVREQCVKAGYARIIREAGGCLLTDTCSAIAQAVPAGTRVVALDSAKQTHYLPAIMKVQGWFGSTAECIAAALSGRWNGRAP